MARLAEFKSEMALRLRYSLKELKFIISRVKRSPLSLIGATMLLVFIVIGLFAPVLAPPSSDINPYIMPYEGPPITEYIIWPPPSAPSAKHPFGTLDGFDLYYGCIWGVRTAFRTGLLVVLGALMIGLLMGCVAGYHGGIVDTFLMRIADIFFAFPSVLLTMLLFIALPPVWQVSLGLTSFEITFSLIDNLIVALILVRWPFYARLIRGEIMKVKNEDYVESAKAIGCSGPGVMVRHILPNSIYPVLTMAFLDIGGIVLVAATLTFLGLGPRMGYAEWGTIINAAQRFILASPRNPLKYVYAFLYPSMFISAFVLAWSLVGDSLRDIMDPAIRRR